MDLNKIYHGDCLELMKDIPDKSIDLILCDPPFGIDYQSAWRIEKTERFDKIANDKTPFTDFINPDLSRIIKDNGAALIFTRWDVQNAFMDALKGINLEVKSIIIWDKGTHSMGDLKKSYGRSYESILFAPNKDFEFPNGRPSDIVRCNRVSADKLQHPNEKPVELLAKLIRDTTQMGGVVLDLTAGSGSTLVAAIREKRNFIGFELSKEYYELSNKRIKLELMQPRMF